jgi:hypothetical protein
VSHAADITQLVAISHRRLQDGIDRWKEQMDAAIATGDPQAVLVLLANTGTQLSQSVAQVQTMPMAEHLGAWIADSSES